MKNLIKKSLVATLALGLAIAGIACSKASLKDGTYQGSYYAEGDHPSTFEVSLVIKDGKITEVTAVEKDDKGNPKDEHYGEGLDEKLYKLAQTSVEGFKKYPAMLIETQSVEKMDAVTGATNSFKGFKAAVEAALSQAK